MCCHTGMPCCRHRTRHSTPSQYTDTEPTCRCAIHWCRTSHWNTQLPILMSWVRPDWGVLPRPSTHTSEHSTLRCCYGGSQSEARKRCEAILLKYVYSEWGDLLLVITVFLKRFLIKMPLKISSKYNIFSHQTSLARNNTGRKWLH